MNLTENWEVDKATLPSNKSEIKFELLFPPHKKMGKKKDLVLIPGRTDLLGVSQSGEA